MLLDCREPPDTIILESLFRAQIRRHCLMKQDMHDYNETTPNNPNKTYDRFRQRVLDNLELLPT
eukprot:8851875-Pyramimonas_sp.AAC.1